MATGATFAASGTAVAGDFGLGSLAKIVGVAGTAYALTDTAPDMNTIKKSDRSLWDMIFGSNPSDAADMLTPFRITLVASATGEMLP